MVDSNKPDQHFHIAVIGGGIHGVGVAQAAAAAGYSVVVIEQNELASATSSKSSKLIHGGLRYLESGQYTLVRESLRERSLLLKNAASLVKLQPFHIPVYPHTSRRPWLLRLGLSLYVLFTGLSRGAYFKTLPKRRWSGLDGLKTENLQAVFRYWDGASDDRKLTKAVMASAHALGAELFMPVKLLKITKRENWQLDLQQGSKKRSIRADVIVNASGPWVNDVLQLVEPALSALPMECVQGTHIVIDAKHEKGYYYLEAPQDQRAVFVMPWYGKLLVGTTEKSYQGDPAKVKATKEEQEYLLGVLKHYFPKFEKLQRSDIVESFAGLRVLPAGEDNAFSRPRDTRLWQDGKHPQLLSLYGGKLTTYRATAEKVVKQLKPFLPKVKRKASTAKLKLD